MRSVRDSDFVGIAFWVICAGGFFFVKYITIPMWCFLIDKFSEKTTYTQDAVMTEKREYYTEQRGDTVYVYPTSITLAADSLNQKGSLKIQYSFK